MLNAGLRSALPAIPVPNLALGLVDGLAKGIVGGIPNGDVEGPGGALLRLPLEFSRSVDASQASRSTGGLAPPMTDAHSRPNEPTPSGTWSAEELGRRVEENLDWLRGWMRSRVRDRDAVDDLCQDAFLKALRSSKSLKDPARFSSWLFRIAVNTLRDYLRSQKRRRARERFTGEEAELDRAASTAAQEPADAAASRKETADRILSAIDSLPAKLREPILLRHSRALPYAKIAEILGITETAVQVRIFRAREKLRAKLGTLVAQQDGAAPTPSHAAPRRKSNHDK